MIQHTYIRTVIHTVGNKRIIKFTSEQKAKVGKQAVEHRVATYVQQHLPVKMCISEIFSCLSICEKFVPRNLGATW